MKKRIASLFLAIVTVLSCFFVIGCNSNGTKYADLTNWAYFDFEKTEKNADVFFVCPTVYSGTEGCHNMPLDDIKARESFVGATNMEKGIYDEECRFFAPFYSQADMGAYELSESEREPYLQTAYNDVKEAFEYYMRNENDGRPIILAGFSQGADLCIRLLKDCFKDDDVNELLVACYAIGWRITEEELKEYPHLKFATGENDTGVIVCFNSEAENITDSLIIPEGTKTLAINPLNWKTDSTPADRDLNKGACFTNYSGEIKSETPYLTGAYIDEERGALKVTDVSVEDYPPVLDVFESGIYHLYDYQFFYRNLQENVKARVTAYLSK